ncbi:MAG: inorganic phosphate transporter [Terracidiphilus sp.]
MADLATTVDSLPSSGSMLDRKLTKSPSRLGIAAFLLALAGGLWYIGFHVALDLDSVIITSIWPYLLLGLALVIALGFEFVNGFHDTANAVATVIYTHSLDPTIAVVLSGICNLLGVLLSSGTVAFAVITLLPVELILQVSSGAGFAMVFALLIAAIVWNLSTWWFGLPASSSHTMVGSIIGVGIANQLMHARNGTSGLDWEQATKVLKALLISPLVGFLFAGLLVVLAKALTDTDWARRMAFIYQANYRKPVWALVRILVAGVIGSSLLSLAAWLFSIFGIAKWLPILAIEKWDAPFGLLFTVFSIGLVIHISFAVLAGFVLKHGEVLFEAPKDNQPPPWPIRALMIITCTGVSFFHGSNDGQKGMGLIMLILIGTVPTAYALNHAVTTSDVQEFIAASEQAGQILDRHVDKNGVLGEDARTEVTDYIRTKQMQPDTILALRELVEDLNHEVALYKVFKSVPAPDQANVRNDMYVAGEAIRLMQKNDLNLVKEGKQPLFNQAESASLATYKTKVDKATRFIPDWVKVAVALALGLGTMVGWKRVVVTVGEKIGKDHLNYAQGASAGLVTMGTIFAANTWALPVSTTHILSSGVAGTMTANGSGLRFATVRNIAAGWVCTLPAAALLSGTLYWLFRAIS